MDVRLSLCGVVRCGAWQIQTKTRSNPKRLNMPRMLLYSLVIAALALALVQACHQVHHNLTFPAVSEVCSGRSLGQSLTRDLSTMSLEVSALAKLCHYGNPFSLGH
ncbi:LOW QUALITY PROTEIN: uncharacterized protein LOC111078727 [Drosophila obscura]|uniref:LOW QUALITY PROTEIN: uncharacterized protein LOC111078727 n=1 Tax=Drosophila obscura TaxID=7282 RepID=UPI001BB2289F|nr:LOW QUALITY PROTEIN: uncharacterized protein LOC111078727 [Drosophila obscura]